MDLFLWKIGGEAGFGIMTTGLSFGKVAIRSGYHVFDYNEYPSLIRGGHNTYEVMISSQEVYAQKQDIDLLVCLNKDTYTHHKHRLTDKSIVVYDADEFTIEETGFVKLHIPFASMKKEHHVMQIMVNTIALGASLALLSGDIAIFYEIIEKEFKRKGEEVIAFNKKLTDLGFNYIKEHYSEHIKPVLTRKQEKSKMILTGNDAFSLAAVVADCRFYAAYPMTPSSTVLTSLAGWQDKSKMVVRHAEDEIAVMNTVLGASFAGVRSATGTSGGGFALMVEGISFAGVAEISVVVFLSQRPGPATGMPTWTEQGDLLFAVNAGHGEFPKIVLAPGDIHEMFELTLKAFDLADIYQMPVIVMSDKFLSESHKSVNKEDISNLFANYHPNRGKLVNAPGEGKYLRYKITDDGISERLLPGAPGAFYQVNSYEHVEDGHTTEEAAPRIEQVDKRSRKWQTYLDSHFKAPRVYGDIETADAVFVSWGGNKGPIIEAQKMLDAQGKKTAYIHFTHIYPMNTSIVKDILSKDKRYILIENNAHGQFGKLLTMETGIMIKESLLKYDGRPIYKEEIVAKVNT
ncbi:MAG: hypothetical protein RI947_1060 [Candidatus Parcubacteria bacterium]|jgi:2-oxoglutarate ferredoxin oxidoreductase subunit alpha